MMFKCKNPFGALVLPELIMLASRLVSSTEFAIQLGLLEPQFASIIKQQFLKNVLVFPEGA